MPDNTEERKPSSIADIIQELDYVEENRQPTIEDYLKIDIYFSEIQQAIKIIRGYQTNSSQYDIARMNEDLIILSSIHVSTAEMIGYVQGYARRAEEVRKITKSKYSIQIKKKRDELQEKHNTSIKVTDPEIDNASRMMSEEMYITASDAETISHMMRYAWYAIGDFIKILNSSINRSHQELFYGTNGEGHKDIRVYSKSTQREDD